MIYLEAVLFEPANVTPFAERVGERRRTTGGKLAVFRGLGRGWCL